MPCPPPLVPPLDVPLGLPRATPPLLVVAPLVLARKADIAAPVKGAGLVDAAADASRGFSFVDDVATDSLSWAGFLDIPDPLRGAELVDTAEPLRGGGLLDTADPLKGAGLVDTADSLRKR